MGQSGRKFQNSGGLAERLPNLRLVFSLVLLFGFALAISGCFGGTSEYSWRQKVAVVVDSPDGQVTGSAVQQVRIVKANSAPAGIQAGSETYLTAEAVVVDLGTNKGGSRYLFALISNSGVMLQSILTPKEGARTHEALKTADSVATGTVLTVPRKNYPLLVTFDDINDPASVKRVDPANLDAAFGCPPSVAGQASGASAGARTGAQTGESADAPAKDKPCYALKSITLEITDEPVTEGKVEAVLGWTASNDQIDQAWFSVGTAKRKLFQGLREPLRANP